MALIAEIDQELSAFDAGSEQTAPNSTLRSAGRAAPKAATLIPRNANGTRAQRGALKDAIIELVKGAGGDGIKVGEIAARIGVKYGNINTWVNTTGKAVKEIRKVGKARYAWVA